MFYRPLDRFHQMNLLADGDNILGTVEYVATQLGRARTASTHAVRLVVAGTNIVPGCGNCCSAGHRDDESSDPS